MSRKIILIDIGTSLALSGILPAVDIGGSYSAKVTARNGQPPYTYSIDGMLPAGMYFDTGTGVFNASSVTEAGEFPVAITAKDIIGRTVTRNYVIVVVALPLSISGHAPDGTVGVPASYTYAIGGGVPPYSVAITAGMVPAGKTMHSSGTLDGTPTDGIGPSDTPDSFDVTVTDANSATATVTDAMRISYAALAITGDFADATVGTAYSSSVPITGGQEPYSLTGGDGIVSGSLDSGFALSITGSTGARFLTLTCASPATGDTMAFTASVDSSDGQTATSAQSIDIVTPSASDPYWENVVALLQFAGTNGSTTITDATGKAWSAHGSAAISTAGPFPGTNSIDVGNSSGNYVETDSASSDFAFGTGDFTVEAFVYDNGDPSNQARAICQPNSAYILMLGIRFGTSYLNFKSFIYDNGQQAFSPQTDNGVFKHVAWCRISGVDYSFTDGVMSSGFTGGKNYALAGKASFGSWFHVSPMNGKLAQCRITKGIARYTADFTPPTEPFPDHG